MIPLRVQLRHLTQTQEIFLHREPFPGAKLVGSRGVTAEAVKRPDEVETIEVETYPFSAELSHVTTLSRPISAKLSIPYAVAAAIHTGGLGHNSYLMGNLGREDYLNLAKRIKVTTVEHYGEGPFGVRGSVVKVSLHNGQRLCYETLHSRWDRQIPPSDSELEAKLYQLAQGVLPQQRSEALVSLIWRLEEIERASGIVDFL